MGVGALLGQGAGGGGVNFTGTNTCGARRHGRDLASALSGQLPPAMNDVGFDPVRHRHARHRSARHFALGHDLRLNSRL